VIRNGVSMPPRSKRSDSTSRSATDPGSASVAHERPEGPGPSLQWDRRRGYSTRTRRSIQLLFRDGGNALPNVPVTPCALTLLLPTNGSLAKELVIIGRSLQQST
jgi:hypothetical protein